MSFNLTDSSLEITDPNPDIYILFNNFNVNFFFGKLGAVEVKWSKRMTLCAGICRYRRNAGCVIGLSQPLLKYRPRKDLVETLLHEMIHAYLFVTHNNKDRDGHGPEFLNHMKRINNIANTNITVYHGFHREVDEHRKHWWRCEGLCRQKPPYYGLVKRAMNRPPGPYDYWWNDHNRDCGGSFIKICSPPEPTKTNKSLKTNKPFKRKKSLNPTDKNSESELASIKKWLIPASDSVKEAPIIHPINPQSENLMSKEKLNIEIITSLPGKCINQSSQNFTSIIKTPSGNSDIANYAKANKALKELHISRLKESNTKNAFLPFRSTVKDIITIDID